MKSVADICYLPIDGPSLPQALALPKALGYDAAGTIGGTAPQEAVSGQVNAWPAGSSAPGLTGEPPTS